MTKIFFYLYLGIFVFLALPVIKLGPARVEQLLVLSTFVLLLYDDYMKRELDLTISVIMIAFAMILALVSLNSDYPKVDEKGYFIKFLFLYPASFYVGMRAMSKMSIDTLIKAIDYSLWFYVISWFIVMYVPVPMPILSKVIHIRDFGYGGEFLPLQGTFYEAAGVGIIVGTMLLISMMIRYEFDIWTKNKNYTYLLYLLSFYMLFFSKNKTVWLAYILILFFFSIYKGYLILAQSSYYSPAQYLQTHKTLSRFLKINTTYLVFGGIVLLLSLAIYNTFATHPFITMREFNYKMAHERGAQFSISWDLISKSNYFGGYGLGFVEVYFEGKNVLGVGKGAGSINNILLDIWLQGSILGVIYLLWLFAISFSRRYFVTIAIPVFLFFFGLTNPIVAEEFFMFLGLSYSLKRVKHEPKYI